MKKEVLFLFVLFSLASFVLAGESFRLEVGESKEFSGYDILLKSVKTDKAVVAVNNESAIINIDEEKTILGVSITLDEIIYFGNNEGIVTLNVSSLYECGDGVCNGFETEESCCRDCGCQEGYDCESNECIVHVDNECERDEDCDDGDENTLDQCTDDIPKVCRHISSVICSEDIDCDDSNPCTTDRCVNNDCLNEAIANCISGEEGDSVDIEAEEDEDLVQDLLEPEKRDSVFQKIMDFFKRLFGAD